jgi:hypothetical protein
MLSAAYFWPVEVFGPLVVEVVIEVMVEVVAGSGVLVAGVEVEAGAED